MQRYQEKRLQRNLSFIQVDRHTEFTSVVQKWLNHEWKEEFDVDVDPFDKATFPCIVPMGEFILASNDSLISINC